MIRYCAIAVVIFGSLSQSAGAQSPEPSKSPIRLLPNYVATDQPKDVPRRAEPRPGPVPPPLPTPTATMQPWEHLMIAADHLEQAGHQDEADELRARAHRKKNEERLSTEQLRRELDRLRGELDALETRLAASQQIKVRLTAIEFSEDQIRAAAPQFLDALTAASANKGLLKDAPAVLAQLGELKESGLVRLLADPVLITMSGRPVSAMSGGEFPVPIVSSTGKKTVEQRQFGIRVEALAKVLSGRRLRLEIKHSISQPDFSSTLSVHGGAVSSITTRALNTALEMEAGETVVIGGMRSQRRDASTRSPDGMEQTLTTQFFVLVTADIVQRGGASEGPAPPPAGN